MNICRYLVFILLVLMAGTIRAQQEQEISGSPLRIEIPATSDAETYTVIPCGTTGMVIFYQSIEVDESQRIRWYFTLYDKHLQPLWTKGVPLLPGVAYRYSELNRDTLFLYFQTDQKSQENGSKFQVVRAILKNSSFIINTGSLPGGSEYSGFRRIGEKVFIALNVRNDIAQLAVVDLPTGNIVLTPMGAGSQTAFLMMDIDTATGQVTALVQKYISKKLSDNYLLRINREGTVLSETQVNTISSERQLSGGLFGYPVPGEKLIAGTYVLSQVLLSDQLKLPVKKSTGFFTTAFNGDSQQSLYFYNFLDLGSIKTILSERDLMALRKKTMKKGGTEQETSGDFYALLHQGFYHKDEFIVVAELFYPQYHTETFSDYDFYGRPITNTYSVFDGFHFTSAVAAAFNKEGILLWDHCIEFRNLITTDLSPKAVLYLQGNDFIMAYLSEGRIASKLFREKQGEEKTEYSEIALPGSADKLIRESRSRLVHWYDNYFLASGYQDIKDISKGNNAKRLVFYCTKILAE
jgi:hypothetical protein